MSNDAKTVVLIADDEPSTLALLGRHLRSRGFGVLEAADGDEAWELAHEHLPDLVVLDVMMPGMSGWEVCRKVREAVSLAHTGVIMLTGIGETLNEMTSPLYGADAHVDKPFEFAALDARIGEVLERRRAGAFGRPDHADEEDVRVAMPSEAAKPIAKAKPAPAKAKPTPASKTAPAKAKPVPAKAKAAPAAKKAPPVQAKAKPAKAPKKAKPPAKKPAKKAPPKAKATKKAKPVAKKPAKAAKTPTKAKTPPPKAKPAQKPKAAAKKPAKAKAKAKTPPPKAKPAKKRR